jgi:nitrogen-specific signal transduction histidine kinase
LDTKEHESGSGLGLAIAKQAIELNKGEIQAITTKDNFEIKIKLPIRAESKF